MARPQGLLPWWRSEAQASERRAGRAPGRSASLRPSCIGERVRPLGRSRQAVAAGPTLANSYRGRKSSPSAIMASPRGCAVPTRASGMFGPRVSPSAPASRTRNSRAPAGRRPGAACIARRRPGSRRRRCHKRAWPILRAARNSRGDRRRSVELLVVASCARILLELGLLGRVDMVADDTCDHGSASLSRIVSRLARRSMPRLRSPTLRPAPKRRQLPCVRPRRRSSHADGVLSAISAQEPSGRPA